MARMKTVAEILETTIPESLALAARAPVRCRKARRHSAVASRAAKSLPVWIIPAPLSGATYSQVELATALGCSHRTIQHWLYTGLRVRGQTVKLRALRAPRGRITVSAVREFLGTVNGVEVRVGKEGRN